MKQYSEGLSTRFQQLLDHREQDLRNLIQTTQHGAKAPDGMAGREVTDFKDAALEQSRAVVEDELAERALHELEQVNTARGRLASHSFGYCLDCGYAIDLQRLEALPATPFCTCCQSAFERSRKAGVVF